MNKDGKVSWHEWQAIMFHEGGQVFLMELKRDCFVAGVP
jgi:hypothetical protein